MAKEFIFRGKSLDEIRAMDRGQFAELLTARERRSLKRGLSKVQLKFLAKLAQKRAKPIRTHTRSLVIFPEMLDKTILVYNGKEFVHIDVIPEMLGHRLGEYAPTRRSVRHSAPGMGATRSSKFVALK